MTLAAHAQGSNHFKSPPERGLPPVVDLREASGKAHQPSDAADQHSHRLRLSAAVLGATPTVRSAMQPPGSPVWTYSAGNSRAKCAAAFNLRLPGTGEGGDTDGR